MRKKAIFTITAADTDFFYSTDCELEETGAGRVIYFAETPQTALTFMCAMGFSEDCISVMRKGDDGKYNLVYFGVGKDTEPVLPLNFGIYQIGLINENFQIKDLEDGFSVRLSGYRKRFGEKIDKSSKILTFVLRVKVIN